jgi:hypothetical protein
MNNDRLKPEEAREMPAWLRHFLVFVVKRSASILVDWIEGLKEATKEPSSGRR